jgi:hypothetical protein
MRWTLKLTKLLEIIAFSNKLQNYYNVQTVQLKKIGLKPEFKILLANQVTPKNF